MNKIDSTSLDLEKLNVEKIKELFPNVVTEGKIDFDKLKIILGDQVDDRVEKYQFTWNGKSSTIKLAQSPSTGTLIPSKDDSKNWDKTGNLYIEGDNLEVLKQLQKTYYGKIKMIYIDPPYNTGGDFVYKDDFKDNIQNYKEQTKQTSRANPETNGRYHTDWLNMMYSRLMLAKNLLAQDGVIFISIDDNEVNNLLKITTEIFGESNFVGLLPTIMNLKGNNDQFGFAGTHEYTLVFMKNIEGRDDLFGIPLTEEDENDYPFEDNEGKYKQGATLMRTGVAGAREQRPKGYYPIYVSKNLTTISINRMEATDYEIFPKTKTGKEMSWRRSPETLMSSINEIIVTKTKNGISFYKKQRLSEDKLNGKKAKSLFYKPEYSSGNGTEQLKTIFNERIFDSPKPLELILDFLRIGIKEGMVLDFFSGSGTTAHAVMQLNAEDGGNRKFIMVQLPELTDESSEAYKAGYKNICEIGKERIRRAGEQIKQDLIEKKNKAGLLDDNIVDPETFDNGFKVFKLESTNIIPWDGTIKFDEDTIFSQTEVIKEDRTSLDVLYEIMLKYGVFDKPVEEIKVNGKTMYSIAKGYLIVCLDNNISLEDVKEIGKLKPRNVIFKESGFRNDNDKINATYTLEKLGVEEVKSI